jgi:drug/metabolite transporter (DMT)-like permease
MQLFFEHTFLLVFWKSEIRNLCRDIAGNNLAGPTIFSIIYSSVTVWAAIYSKFLLARSMSKKQWIGVILVVFGLSVTALDSVSEGKHVFAGALLILIGSSLHAITYVLSEMIMMPPSETESTGQLVKFRLEPISVRANCAIQGIVACLAFLMWQIVYTLPRFQSLILDEMNAVGTTPFHALCILISITGANVVHSVAFFQTLKDFPGGATSAGVLKGLQAVLVFLISSMVLCGRIGGSEMCWTHTKLLSLIVVVFGILFYGKATTTKAEKESKWKDGSGVNSVEKNHSVNVV